MPSCMPGPRPTRRSRCSDLSSCTCFVNWLSGLPAVEHSAPPRNDMAGAGVCGAKGARDRREGAEGQRCSRRARDWCISTRKVGCGVEAIGQQMVIKMPRLRSAGRRRRRLRLPSCHGMRRPHPGALHVSEPQARNSTVHCHARRSARCPLRSPATRQGLRVFAAALPSPYVMIAEQSISADSNTIFLTRSPPTVNLPDSLAPSFSRTTTHTSTETLAHPCTSHWSGACVAQAAPCGCTSRRH